MTKKQKPKMDARELTDEIYDTLMGLVGMSEYHVPFDNTRVTDQECNAQEGIIHLNIGRKTYTIKVTEQNRVRLHD